MIMAFGYPAEPLERSYEDFRRIELKKLVTIRGAFGKVQRKLLEAARLAPSAMNRQPWRFVSSEDRIHLFVKKRERSVIRCSRISTCSMREWHFPICL